MVGILWWLSQRFKLFTRDGREIPVISGSVPPHLTRGKGGPTMPPLQISSLMAVLRIRLRQKALESVLGDTIVPDSSAILTANEKNIISKAWDNPLWSSYGERVGRSFVRSKTRK